MLNSSDHKLSQAEQGMTLFELLIVITVLGLLISQTIPMAVNAFSQGKSPELVEKNFLAWMKRVERATVFNSSPLRLTVDKRQVWVERYLADGRWERTGQMYLPPNEIRPIYKKNGVEIVEGSVAIDINGTYPPLTLHL